ncbi:hypothetical protein Moror_5756 [Moniliophthora roreri MCA 2997]|uniref:Uncharacterized protein n=2 Tax=Moniliophthora roreri TaxID=221103 RepID=V2X3D0_MONRO|nr:hypothetical protein Moror_5756 [Moniliophthora roreri MCA 2997]
MNLESFHLILFSVLFFFTSFSKAYKNITLDDVDSLIHYSVGWSVPPTSNIGGSHHLTGYRENASLVFDFTGVAVYIISPLWPYKVGGFVSIDATPPIGIDMRDYTRPDPGMVHGEETVNTSVIWGMTELANTAHSLRVWTDTARWDYLALDGIIYTVLLGDNHVGSADSNSTILSIPNTQAPASCPPLIEQYTPLIGSLFGIIGLLLLCFLPWIIWRRVKRARWVQTQGDPENLEQYSISPFFVGQPSPPSCHDSLRRPRSWNTVADVSGSKDMPQGFGIPLNYGFKKLACLPQPPAPSYRSQEREMVDVMFDSRPEILAKASLYRVKTWSGAT